MTRSEILTGVLLPLVLALIPVIDRRTERKRKIVCDICGTSAPDLPRDTLDRIGWTAEKPIMLVCPNCPKPKKETP